MSNTFIHLPRSGSTAITGPIDVNIDGNDKIKITDNDGDILNVTPDGKLQIDGVITGNVNAVVTGVNEFEFAETTIAGGGTTTVVTRSFPDEYKLRRVRGSGENVAVYYLKFSGSGVDKMRSTYTDFNALMDFETGVTIPAGTVVTVDVTNSTSSPALFSVQLLFSAV